MTQIFGEFREELPQSDQFLVISFSPSSIPLKQRWRNNGLSADFVADYLTTFFPVNEDEPSTIARQAELRSAVNYIANELLENAMKFHDESTNSAIQFGIHLLKETVVLFSTNCVSLSVLEKFQSVIQKLINSDPEELYIQQLEMIAENENSFDSGLGLLTIMHDYSAKLGWKTEPIQKDFRTTTITTMVQLFV